VPGRTAANGKPPSRTSPGARGNQNARVGSVPRYRIVYVALEDGIDIIRVLHSSQDVYAILDEDESPPGNSDE
jgi:plasmid stabilization system protein ParE